MNNGQPAGYAYPDKNDAITIGLIETEYDSAYWDESERIKYLLELLESDLDLLYQSSTNRFVNVLTVTGLVIALFQLITGLL